MRLPLSDLKRAVEEQAALRGLFIENVYQSGPRSFLLKLKPGPIFLILDCGPGTARVLVTDAPPEVPAAPPVFGAILRRTLRGGRLLGTMLPQEDRVVALDVDADGPRRVVVEAFARHANLLLLDAEGRVERVLDGDAAQWRGNPVGAAYTLPAPPTIPAEDSLLPAELSGSPFAANHALDRLVRDSASEKSDASQQSDRKRALDRLRRTRRAVEGDLKELRDPARLRTQGELLLSHYAELRRGMRSFRGVALEPGLSPQENVERLFERARKAERARPEIERRLREIDELIRRTEAGDPLPAQLRLARKGERPPPRKPYRRFTSRDGHRILVGKGGRDNDETTLRVAGPHDLFLHVRGTPGAHVIVPLRRDEEVMEQTLLDAAMLALHYSKQRAAAAADVTYTRRKFVSKPRGAKPGLVSVQREKVLRLRREPERLARLLMTAGEGE